MRSGLLVIALIVLTRGISLGGLSDFVDALGPGNHAREGSAGSMGILLVIGALLLKFAALSELQGHERYVALLLSPILARAAMAYLIAAPSSAQEAVGGSREFARPSSPREGYIALGWSFLLCFLLGWFWGLFLAIVALCVTWCLKRFLGNTGNTEKEVRDAPGAVSEIVETMTLVLFSA